MRSWALPLGGALVALGIGALAACEAPDPSVVSGRVVLAPGVRSTLGESDALFVVARSGDGKPGPPVAVVKHLGARLPMSYRIGQEDVLEPGRFFREPVRIRVIVRRSGFVGVPGPEDMEGEATGTVQPGTEGVDVVLRPLR
ncbi:MAG: hypothetical protein VKS61_07940 [Candidatus Sericytochromatia bacterium]|nr:hypothetical protein [Candidatus Sericytochromatia bacterium]